MLRGLNKIWVAISTISAPCTPNPSNFWWQLRFTARDCIDSPEHNSCSVPHRAPNILLSNFTDRYTKECAQPRRSNTHTTCELRSKHRVVSRTHVGNKMQLLTGSSSMSVHSILWGYNLALKCWLNFPPFPSCIGFVFKKIFHRSWQSLLNSVCSTQGMWETNMITIFHLQSVQSIILPHQVKMQYLHFRFHANYTFFYSGRFLKKLADDQCSSISKGSIYHINHMDMQPFTTVVSWPEIGCLMEVSTMFDICTYCIFTWDGRIPIPTKAAKSVVKIIFQKCWNSKL